MSCVNQTTEKLCAEISAKIKEVNGGVPSAVFLSGGGSRLKGLREGIINALEMNPGRVAIAGNNFKIHAFSDTIDINNPEYATPIGILVSSGLNLINDSFQITLNGRPAKLFRSGAFTARDLLMMNGYSYQDMIGRSGKNIVVSVNGERVVFYGTHAEPAVLKINGREGKLSDTIHAGDEITFTSAVNGTTPDCTLKDIQGIDGAKRVRLNGESVALSTPLKFGDIITFEEADEAGYGSFAETTDDEILGDWDYLAEPVMAEAAVNTEEPASAEEPEPATVEAAVSAEVPVSAEEPVMAEAAVSTEEPANAEEAVSEEKADVSMVVSDEPVEPAGSAGPTAPAAPEITAAPDAVSVPSMTFMLNDKPLTLMRRDKDNPYLLMDMLEYAELDFNNLKGQVILQVNGKNGYFQQPLCEGDSISIFEQEK